MKAQLKKELYAKATEAMKNAYAPYSGFTVGAAVLLKDGRVITAGNVENASYGLTICAERAAIFSAVSQGVKPGDIVAIAIDANASGFSPCGACRQVIKEFSTEDTDIMVIFPWNGKLVSKPISKLLNFGFQL